MNKFGKKSGTTKFLEKVLKNSKKDSHEKRTIHAK
jgi:hypothetical protein